MITVRALDRVQPQRLALAFRLVNAEVFPALRNVIGADLHYPGVVHLCSPRAGEALLGSAIGVTLTGDGAVTHVEVPVVGAADDDQVLRLLLVYQLARFHELTERKVEKVKIWEPSAGSLWSAYYAHRVASASGLVAPELLGGLGLGLAKAEELVWLKALQDEGLSEAGRMAAAGGALADSVEKFALLDVPERLYDDFPNWDGDDRLLCATFFATIGSMGLALQVLAEARRNWEPKEA